MANTHFVLPLHYKNISQATADWSDEEFGCYVRLLIHQWDRGGVPVDLSRLKRISESIEKNQALVLAKFELVDGKYSNLVMEEIRAEKISFSKKQSQNGAKGGRKRKPDQTQVQPRKKPQEGEGEEEEEGVVKGKGVISVVEHPLQVHIRDSFKEVSKLKIQLTYQQADELVNKYDRKIIHTVLLAMENKADLLKKYKSVYLTIDNWCKREMENGKANSTSTASGFDPEKVRGLFKSLKESESGDSDKLLQAPINPDTEPGA